jgi:hypothetical protein
MLTDWRSRSDSMQVRSSPTCTRASPEPNCFQRSWTRRLQICSSQRSSPSEETSKSRIQISNRLMRLKATIRATAKVKTTLRASRRRATGRTPVTRNFRESSRSTTRRRAKLTSGR